MSTKTQDQAPSDRFLTQVETLYVEGELNFRLLFGHPLKVVEKEFTYGRRTRKIAYFRPGDVFAVDLWRRNAYGTNAWAVYVLQAAGPGETAPPTILSGSARSRDVATKNCSDSRKLMGLARGP